MFTDAREYGYGIRFTSGASKHAMQISGLLDDDAFPVRTKACEALGELKYDDDIAKLVELFQDTSASVRFSAVVAVGSMGDAASPYANDIFKLFKKYTDKIIEE